MTQPNIPSFGVQLVGPRFAWTWLDENDEVQSKEFRAKHGLSFEELVEYNSLGGFIQAEAVISAKRLREELDAVGTDEGALEKFREVTYESNEDERRRWNMIVEQALMLVSPKDVDELRPLLEKGNPSDVRDLRDDLKDRVIDRIVPEVTIAAHVDPTSPPSGTDSPATDESGESSESGE